MFIFLLHKSFGIFEAFCLAFLGRFVWYFWGVLFGVFGVNDSEGAMFHACFHRRDSLRFSAMILLYIKEDMKYRALAVLFQMPRGGYTPHVRHLLGCGLFSGGLAC